MWRQPRLQRLAATPNPVCSALQLSVRREMNLHRNRKLVRSMKEGADNKSKFKPADGVTFLLLTASIWILANYLLPDRVCLWDVSLGLTGFFFSFVGSSFLSDRMEICSWFLLISKLLRRGTTQRCSFNMSLSVLLLTEASLQSAVLCRFRRRAKC